MMEIIKDHESNSAVSARTMTEHRSVRDDSEKGDNYGCTGRLNSWVWSSKNGITVEITEDLREWDHGGYEDLTAKEVGGKTRAEGLDKHRK